MPRPSVRRAAALSVAALTLSLAGCATTAQTTPERPRVAAPSVSDAADARSSRKVQPLSEPVRRGEARPAWRLPYVDGWDGPVEKSPGVFQLERDSGETLVTAFQLNGYSGDDEEIGRAWLEEYRLGIAEQDWVAEVREPAYGSVAVHSSRGDLEFVSQKLTYRATSGVTYRSLLVARGIGTHVLALQYAASADEWSADVWRQLADEGLQLTL